MTLRVSCGNPICKAPQKSRQHRKYALQNDISHEPHRILKTDSQRSIGAGVRRQLETGQTPETVGLIVQLEPEVIQRIDRRLKIEQALISGDDVDAIGQDQSLDPREVALVARVLRVRGDAARGFSDTELVEHHSVSDAVADTQIDLATTELAKHWETLLSEKRLDTIAQDTLIPEHALLMLVPEMRAREQLWQGTPLETVLEQNPSVPRNRLEEMADSLTDDKAFFAASDLSPSDIAVQLRLPVSALAPA